MTLSPDSLPPGSIRDEAEIAALYADDPADPFTAGRFRMWCHVARFAQNVPPIHEPQMRSKTP